MAQKIDFPRHLGALAKVIYSEMGIGPTREELELLARVQYPQVSALEIDEALLQLTGRTPQHKKCYVWCDPCGRYRVLQEDNDPWVRACVVFEVMREVDSDGANSFQILQSLTMRRKLPNDLVLECIRELQEGGILADEGGGKFVVSFEGASLHTYEEIFISVAQYYSSHMETRV